MGNSCTSDFFQTIVHGNSKNEIRKDWEEEGKKKRKKYAADKEKKIPAAWLQLRTTVLPRPLLPELALLWCLGL